MKRILLSLSMTGLLALAGASFAQGISTNQNTSEAIAALATPQTERDALKRAGSADAADRVAVVFRQPAQEADVWKKGGSFKLVVNDTYQTTLSTGRQGAVFITPSHLIIRMVALEIRGHRFPCTVTQSGMFGKAGASVGLKKIQIDDLRMSADKEHTVESCHVTAFYEPRSENR